MQENLHCKCRNICTVNVEITVQNFDPLIDD